MKLFKRWLALLLAALLAFTTLSLAEETAVQTQEAQLPEVRLHTDKVGNVVFMKGAADAAAAPAAAAAEKPLAPGSAGDLKLYDTDPRDAAMIMAIVADELQKPLNELRFISIREITPEKD